MADPTVTPAQFRASFPAFASQTTYPDDIVSEWLSVAEMMLRPARWGAALSLGLKLFAAHNLALNRQEVKAAASGAVPGISTGVITNKAVGPVSAGFDATAASQLDAGHWNLTTYGTRFYRMALMMGAGPLQSPDNCGILGPPGTVTGGWGDFY